MISKIRHHTCQISDFRTKCYMGGGGGVRFTIWSQTSRAFFAVENREKLMFQATLLQTIIIKVVFSKFLYLIASWTSLIIPKTYQGGTNYNIKISIKITRYQLL